MAPTTSQQAGLAAAVALAPDRPMEENARWSPAKARPCVSVTRAVAVLVDVPLAMIELGDSVTATLEAGPAVWVSVAAPETLGDTVLSVAVIVTG